MSKSIVFEVAPELFKAWIWVFIGTDEKFREWHEDKFGVDAGDCEMYGATNHVVENKKIGLRASVIWLEKFNGSPSSIGTLSHECIHASMRILERVGVPVTLAEHEALAYLQDCILKKALKKLKKKGMM